MANNFEEKDHEKAVILLDAFIQWTNADHEGSITLGRNQCCYMRDEIQRLRALEAQLATAQRELSEARRLAQWTQITPETMPDELIQVLVVWPTRDVTIDFRYKGGWGAPNLGNPPQKAYTHWMPIPVAPPEVKP